MLCGFSSLWWPFGWNWSYLGFLGIIWRTCGSKCRGEGGGIFPTLCVECCLVFVCFQFNGYQGKKYVFFNIYILFARPATSERRTINIRSNSGGRTWKMPIWPPDPGRKITDLTILLLTNDLQNIQYCPPPPPPGYVKCRLSMHASLSCGPTRARSKLLTSIFTHPVHVNF